MTANLVKLARTWPESTLLLLALGIRFCYGCLFLYLNGLETGYDAGDYIQFAEYIQEQGWMVLDITGLKAHSGPGYPILLYLDLTLFNNENFYFSLLIGALFNAATVLVIFRLGKVIFKSPYVALLAAIWSIFYVHYIRYVPFIGKESLIFFLFPFSLLMAIYAGQGSKKGLWLFVLSYLWLIHIDERYFAYLPLLIVTIAWGGQWQLKTPLFALSLIILGMIPWLYRNYVVFDRPVLLTERTAPLTDKLLGYEGLTNKVRGIERKTPYDRDAIPGYEAIIDSLRLDLAPIGHDYKGVKQLKQAVAAGHIPRSYTTPRKFWGEFVELLRPVKFRANFTGYGYRYHPAWRFSSNLIYGVQYGSMLLLSLFGVLHMRRKMSSLVLLLIGFFLMHIAIHLFFGHAIQRYRVPIDFIVILLGSFTLIDIITPERIQQKVNKQKFLPSTQP